MEPQSYKRWMLFIPPPKWYHFNKLVEISKAQDVEAGDGTTTVVVIAGALLRAC